MEETEIVLRDHAPAVHPHAGDFQRRPDRVAGEELIVGRDTGEFDHAELHDDMVDKLLRFLLRQSAFLEIPFDVDIQEGRDSSDGHGSAVLRLDGGEIAEIEPLESLSGVLGRLGDVKAIRLGHLLHRQKGADLLSDFLAAADDILGHRAVAGVGEVFLLLLDKIVDAVEGDATIVADDSSAAIGIGKAGDDMAVPGPTHLGGVDIEDTLVMGLVVFGEDLVEGRVGSIAVGGEALFRHLDAAIGHEGSLQRLVRLKADHLLVSFALRGEIGRAIGGDAGDDVLLHVEDAALASSF